MPLSHATSAHGTALAVVTLLVLAGCTGEKPPAAYDRPVMVAAFESGAPTPDNAYTLLVDEPTTGRFTCSLAVARYAPTEDGIELVAIRQRDQSYWTQQFRGVDAIRDVLFVDPFATRPFGQDLTAVRDAARKLNARLLLLHAPTRTGPNSAAVIGVLYDVDSLTLLATLHASAQFLDDEGEEPDLDASKGDKRNRDALFQAQRRFESHTLECIHALLLRDQQPATTQPHRWHQPFLDPHSPPPRR